MHNRKQYIVYPPNYKPGDGFSVRRSKRQAWKLAARLGNSATVSVCVRSHPRPFVDWTSSKTTHLWEVQTRLLEQFLGVAPSEVTEAPSFIKLSLVPSGTRA